jgi:hypothetical protein
MSWLITKKYSSCDYKYYSKEIYSEKTSGKVIIIRLYT